jgi:hypothetical protein
MHILQEYSSFVFWCAFGLYGVNLLVGVVARLGWYKFGLAHHVLYFIVFVFALAAAALRFHPSLIVTLLALAAMPKSKPHTWKHPALAVAGFAGYCGAVS